MIPDPAASNRDSLMQFMRQEMKAQLSVLQKSIDSISKHHQVENFLNVALQSIEDLLQVISAAKLDVLTPIFIALENYIVETQKGLMVTGDLTALVVSLIAELNQIADRDHEPLEKAIIPRLSSLNRLIAKLYELIEQEKIKSGETHLLQNKIPEQKQEGVKTEEKEILIDTGMFDLFCTELENQCAILSAHLIELEKHPQDEALLTSLMRAAHSIKGAARAVAIDSVNWLAHAMEDCFNAAQKDEIEINTGRIDSLLQAVDFLNQLSHIPSSTIMNWLSEQSTKIQTLIHAIKASSASVLPSIKENKKTKKESSKDKSNSSMSSEPVKEMQRTLNQDRVLRVTAQNLNRLMGLAGEALIESHGLYPFRQSLQKLKKQQDELVKQMNELRESLRKVNLSEATQHHISHMQRSLTDHQYQIVEYISELDHFTRQHTNLSDRLYQEVIDCHMRPFSDLAKTFPRVVRDIAKQLGKQVKLVIEGNSTPVDRDILDKLESPLNHLLRNAVDHGIELPEERKTLGKSEEGVVKVEARHQGGMLIITVSDDGKGIDMNQLKQKIIETNLASTEMVNRLTDQETLNFLFLPGFSTAKKVTEFSGRGIGLNIVQNMIQEVEGSVRVIFHPGEGLKIQLNLPLTLSVMRTLLVEISGESYAFPLAHIEHSIVIDRDEIETLENSQFFRFENDNIGLVSAWQVLELEEPKLKLQQLPIVIFSDSFNSYGLVVDHLIGEKELVVQELSHRFGKIPGVLAGALMEDGSPVLILDVEDIIHFIDKFLLGGNLTQLAYEKEQQPIVKRKRVLVVDDSITVREVQCRLLQNQGYEVDAAVNGIDGWNAVRVGHYDLVITDIDMPRMDGIELVRTIKKDPVLHSIPIMIVTYKDREQDRINGLEAGADYYLTKSSFHETSLIDAVNDLIGKP